MHNTIVKKIIFITVILASLFCIAFGLKQGGFRDNMARASMVCWECIGLGK